MAKPGTLERKSSSILRKGATKSGQEVGEDDVSLNEVLRKRLVLAEVRLPVREGQGVQVTAARRSETLKVPTKFTDHNIQKWHLQAASFDAFKLPKIAFTL